MYGITSSPLQASYIKSQISHACATGRAAKEACLKTGLSPRMDTRCVGIVFYRESNPYAGLNGLASIQKEYLFPAAAEWWPQRGARERLRERGLPAPPLGRGAGRGEGRPTWTTGRAGAGAAGQPANQRGSRRSQPRPAGALAGSGFMLLTTRRGLGPHRLTPRAAGVAGVESQLTLPQTLLLPWQFRTRLWRDVATFFTASLRR